MLQLGALDRWKYLKYTEMVLEEDGVVEVLATDTVKVQSMFFGILDGQAGLRILSWSLSYCLSQGASLYCSLNPPLATVESDLKLTLTVLPMLMNSCGGEEPQ